MAAVAASGGNLIHVYDDKQFKDELEKAGSDLVVVDFFATWCGPCKFIAPHFERFSKLYRNAIFLKVDVDQCQETAMLYGISAMPTFCFMRSKRKLEDVKGADPVALENAIKKHLQNSENKKDQVLTALGRSFDCFKEVIRNKNEAFLSASELLIKIANNVIKDPQNPKYRSIRLDGKMFQSKLFHVPGAVDCLFQMGFEEGDDKLVLPMLCPLENLRALREALLDERDVIELKSRPVDENPPVVVKPPTRRWKPFIRSNGERSFYEKLLSSSNHVFIYEDPRMLAYAVSKMPLDTMRSKAKENSLATKSKDGKVEVDERDCLLLLLLEWFKNKFFRWMDQPKCDFCNINTRGIGRATPTEDDKRWGAGVVENYSCQNCNRNYKFPRYNHPQKLLETREGRCGEWANCFTLCCRAAGFEARYVLDWTDHVWTEVYSEHQKRWMHCDPCENVCDKPLLYEAGWGKKLSYVIGFSKDEVIDVTWRYTRQHKEILERRHEVAETWLVDLWTNMSKELQSSSTAERRKALEGRKIAELIEFLSSKDISEDEKIGRQSGSLAWRSIRGETGPAEAETETKPHILIPTKEELERGRLRIQYCAATDKYYRSLDGSIDDSACVEGWQKCVESSQDIFRKVENDWNMVYLARMEGKSTGKISWRIKIENSSHVIEKVKIRACSKSFENGSVKWTLSGDDGKIVETLPGDSSQFTTSSKFHGSSDLRLTATLSGGKGDTAWQHAQLFRQNVKDLNEFPLDITLHFAKK